MFVSIAGSCRCIDADTLEPISSIDPITLRRCGGLDDAPLSEPTVGVRG